MKQYMGFWNHLERDSLNFYWSEECFDQMLKYTSSMSRNINVFFCRRNYVGGDCVARAGSHVADLPLSGLSR